MRDYFSYLYNLLSTVVFLDMKSRNKGYMDPHLNMKRSRYAEKESDRYPGD